MSFDEDIAAGTLASEAIGEYANLIEWMEGVGTALNDLDGHGHAISDVTGLQAALDAKATTTALNTVSDAVATKAPSTALDTVSAAVVTLSSNLDSTFALANSKADAVHTHSAYARLYALTDGQDTYPRIITSSGGVTLTSGTLRLVFWQATASYTVNDVTACTGGTGAGATPTLCRYGIYTIDGNGLPGSGDLTLAASTVNDTALWASIGTDYTKALSSTLAVVAGRWYATGALCVTGATAPVITGLTLNSAPYANLSPRMTAQRAGQTDLPSAITVANQASATAMPWFAMGSA